MLNFHTIHVSDLGDSFVLEEDPEQSIEMDSPSGLDHQGFFTPRSPRLQSLLPFITPEPPQRLPLHSVFDDEPPQLRPLPSVFDDEPPTLRPLYYVFEEEELPQLIPLDEEPSELSSESTG